MKRHRADNLYAGPAYASTYYPFPNTHLCIPMHHEERVTKLVSPPDLVVQGEYEVKGDFALQVTSASSVGRLQRLSYRMQAECGQAQYTMLGTRHYTVNWGTYQLQKGLAVSGVADNGYIELHIQLGGHVGIVHNNLGMDLHIEPGDTGLAYMPATDSAFELGQDSAGEVFEIHFTVEYFQALADRHPELLGSFRERMLDDEPFWLHRPQMRATPLMIHIIEQIRHREQDNVASPLLLEAQILSLLSLQMEQVATQPAHRNGTSLARQDVDRMYEARDVLLRRMTEPPTLAELARKVGTNECKLKRGFREVFGTSPYALLLEHKLDKGRRLLLDTDCTIAEVAYRIGYSHPSHFTNAFRKQYGIRPSDLR